jgi:hypothetical protein
VKVHKLSFTSHNLMDLHFGTETERGHDKDDITILRIKDQACTQMGLMFKPECGPYVNAGPLDEVELWFRGGAEARGLIELMKLAIAVYEAQSRGEEFGRRSDENEWTTCVYGEEVTYDGFVEEDANEVRHLMEHADYDFRVEPGSEE